MLTHTSVCPTLPVILAAPTLRTVVDLLFQLYPLRQPLLSRHTTQALAALAASPASALSPAMLAEMLAVGVGEGNVHSHARMQGACV